MADECDRAADLQQQEIERGVRTRREEGPQATGECLYCGEEVKGVRWCDADCRDGWEQEQRLCG